MSERFLKDAGVQVPILCGAMYPCSNPELVAAVSKAGALGVVQPLSITYVYKWDFRESLHFIKRESGGRPFAMNVLTEASSSIYLKRMEAWVDIALEEGCKFFITALGNPRWIVERAHRVGAKVYHDVTSLKWAEKARDVGVDGLICVNRSAGGHAGEHSAEELYQALRHLALPLVCAGGVGTEQQHVAMLRLGYDAVQMGTRFIATVECRAHEDYKQAILKARAEDIVLTEKLTGVPVAIINTDFVKEQGTQASWWAKRLLQNPKAKHWMRMFYSLRSFGQLKNAMTRGQAYKQFWQAGKSVEGISSIESVNEIISRFKRCQGTVLSGLKLSEVEGLESETILKWRIMSSGSWKASQDDV